MVDLLDDKVRRVMGDGRRTRASITAEILYNAGADAEKVRDAFFVGPILTALIAIRACRQVAKIEKLPDHLFAEINDG